MKIWDKHKVYNVLATLLGAPCTSIGNKTVSGLFLIFITANILTKYSASYLFSGMLHLSLDQKIALWVISSMIMFFVAYIACNIISAITLIILYVCSSDFKEYHEHTFWKDCENVGVFFTLFLALCISFFWNIKHTFF